MPSEITLGVLVGMGLAPAPQEVLESITQVQVTTSAKDKSGFDLSFAVSKSSPLVTRLLPNGYFDPLTRIVLTVTVRGERAVLVDGVITTHEMVPSDEAGKSVLSIKGEDLTRVMDLIDFSWLPWPAMPREARIAAIMAKYAVPYGIIPMVIPSPLLMVPNPLAEIPVQEGTDLAYIQQLADEAGYVFFLQAGPEPGVNVGYWGPMLKVSLPFLSTPPAIAIDWDGRSNVESLQFAFDGFQKRQWYVLVQLGTVPIPVPVPDVNPISPPLGAKIPMALKVSPMRGMAKYPVLAATALALGRAASTSNVVRGSGTLDVLRYGSILSARTLVEVRGAGITYDGSYFVDSVTHTIKPGSYKQNFSLTRNALVAGGPFSGASDATPAPIPPGTGHVVALPATR